MSDDVRLPLSDEETDSSTKKPWLEVVGSRYLLDWLAEQRVSLAFSTYQTGKLFFIGRKPDKRLGVFERTFAHCMGLWAAGDARTLWMNSRYQLWRFDNMLPAGGQHNGFDAVYVPRIGYTTGHLDVHDIAVEDSGRVVFVNTMFGCLATLSGKASFQPLWRPQFLSALAPEDRCHLNGLGLRDGRVRYVTACGRTDVPEGWRERRGEGGVVIDVPTGETMVGGLSMPHSPRWYRDRLWVLNSGTGQFGYVDTEAGRFEPVAFCPGYLRGLAFVGDWAIVTLSLPRHRTFEDLPLTAALAQRNAEPQCGLYVIDLNTGHVVHTVRLEGIVTELYDAVVLPGLVRPMALGFKSTEIERMVLVDEEGQL
jgi:uncharacterized protein (TIGR03032 family)